MSPNKGGYCQWGAASKDLPRPKLWSEIMDVIEQKMNPAQRLWCACSDIGGGIALFVESYREVVASSETAGKKIKNIVTYPAIVWSRVFRELMREAAFNSKNQKSR